MKKQNKSKKHLRQNFRVFTLLIFVPFIVGVFVVYYLLSDIFAIQLAKKGSDRLVTRDWEAAQTSLQNIQPEYGPKYAYYRIKEGQDLAWAAKHFGVDYNQLKALNPGSVVFNTTVVVPPVQKSLDPIISTTSAAPTLVISQVDGFVSVMNRYKFQQYVTTIPELAKLLAGYNAITKVGDKQYRIEKPLLLNGNIRLDITNQTVSKLELRSSPNRDITCLCAENAEILIKDITISSIDPVTNLPDYRQEDGRSFIRALKSSRMDIINSDISYLGNGLLKDRETNLILKDGGTYGVSWRISDTTLGSEIATGWVENNKIYNNHYGGYTFGASGMMWRGNYFIENEVYGLDPHDDSNNATIENNYFTRNGKHGFIVSKRCNYNVIRNNVSVENKSHGFMLHLDSVYNVIENNIAIDNTDNFAIFASSFNTIRNNKSYNPRGSHVRINVGSKNNFVQNNLFYGGKKGVYAYADDSGLLIVNNTFQGQANILSTEKANKIVFANNNIDHLSYKITKGDRVIFGTNTINRNANIDLSPLLRNYENSY